MIEAALKFLIQTLGNLFVIAVLLRFMMQLFRVPFRNPFAQFIVAITDFAVKPLRRVVPGLWGLDWACLVLAWLVELLVVTAGYWLDGFPFALAGGKVWPVMLGLAAVKLLSLTVYLIIGLTLIRAVLSWVNSDTPLMPVVYTLTEPFLRPLRRIVPMVANIDLTPLVLFILCQLVLMVPVLALQRALLGSL
ncbi:YggT family protein [Thiobacillus denitrificans]|uniref:Integral membrane protein YggT, involved in response to extracytoplasmic stress (Osmotic shock) n=1 Tax=Thiobacillus denitrificans TaxID=36861 RepID=A0A106BQJ0_THIDE|nr:YggT family protein [Thiobacillus denitrificans]KVW96820.1 integral membrane protein YggT, involved in response to extracytoplasmic stress (osmotic shock) [Thiobacillus denitrificans]